MALDPSAANADGMRASDPELDQEELEHQARPSQAPVGHGSGHGMASELVLTAMVVLGVTLMVCAALYSAGAFRAPVQHEAPTSSSQR